MRDLYHNLLAAHSIYPASLGAAAKTGDAYVDLAGYNGALVVCYSGALTVDMPFQLMHSDDHVTFTAVDDADLLGLEPTLLAATDNEVKTIGYIGKKRYLRVDTTTGTGIAGAMIIKGFPRHAPVV